MFIEKMNTENFRDAVSIAQVQMPVATTSQNPQGSDFLKTLEKKSSVESEKNDILDRKETSNISSYDRKTDTTQKDEEISRNNDQKKEKTDIESTNREIREKTEEKKQSESESNSELKDKNRTASSKENSSSGQTEEKKTGEFANLEKMREAFRKQQLHEVESVQTKNLIKENFGESKSTSSSDNLEKVMLKTIEDQGKATETKVVEHTTQKQGNEKNTHDSDSGKDQKNAVEIDTHKVDDKSATKNESKTQKKEAGQENTTFQFILQDSKNTQTNVDPKLKTVAQTTNNLELYQAYKDQITSSVENSIKMLVSNQENKVNIQLQPPELGKVQVELIVKDNIVNAKLHTENIAVREVILTNLEQLKSNLENAGIHVNEFNVEVGGFKNQFDQQFSNGKSGSNGNGGGGYGGNEQGYEKEELLPDRARNQRPLTYFLGRSINVIV